MNDTVKQAKVNTAIRTRPTVDTVRLISCLIQSAPRREKMPVGRTRNIINAFIFLFESLSSMSRSEDTRYHGKYRSPNTIALKRMMVGMAQMAMVLVSIRRVFLASVVVVVVSALYSFLCGSLETAQGMNNPTIKVVHHDIPRHAASSNLIMAVNVPMAIIPNITVESSRRTMMINRYPVNRKTHVVKEYAP